jgi:hypothetical protein
VAQFWHALPKRRTHVYAAAAGLFLGIAPVLAYNIQCPQNGLVRLLMDRSVPNLMQGSIGDKFLLRLNQFASLNLLARNRSMNYICPTLRWLRPSSWPPF